jgi:hypothetical protein
MSLSIEVALTLHLAIVVALKLYFVVDLFEAFLARVLQLATHLLPHLLPHSKHFLCGHEFQLI